MLLKVNKKIFKRLYVNLFMKESYVVKIGSKLRKVLDMQKEVIKDLTYDIVNASDYEAGEIIADKIIKNKLV